MKLIYITHSIPWGRGEDFIYPELHELTKNGHELLIIPFAPQRKENSAHRNSYFKHSIYLNLFNFRTFASFLLGLFTNFALAIKYIFLFRKSQNLRMYIANVRALCKALSITKITKEFQPDHIHAHWATNPATLAMVLSELVEVPWSMTAHRHDIVDNNLLGDKIKRASFTRFISKSGLELADKITKFKNYQENSTVKVIHMGIKVKDKRSVPNAIKSEIIFVCVANLKKVKGHKYLLEAFSKVRQEKKKVKLLIVGDGYLRDKLEQKAKNLGVEESVRFLGRLPNEEIISWYRSGKIFANVLPSVSLGKGYHEGIPYSLIEAMSFGIPVISTETGGISELIEEGKGILVPDKDSDKLAEAMQLLIDDKDLYEDISNKAYQKINKEFNIEHVVQELINSFKHSVNHKK